MRRMFPYIFAVGLLCGCQGTGPAKVDNPVVGPPPPRLPPERIRENQIAAGLIPDDDRADIGTASVADSTVPGTGKSRVKVDEEEAPTKYVANSIDDVPVSSGPLRRVSEETVKAEGLPAFEDTMVVALVNDQPVFAGEVLGPLRPQLKAHELKLKKAYGDKYDPKMMYAVRAQALQMNLPHVTDTKILYQAAKASIKPKQFEALGKQVDTQWAEEIDKIMAASNVKSVNELEQLMKEQNYDMRENSAKFKEENIARGFVSSKVHSSYEPTRKELLAYYEEHREEYEFPARAQWQQLLVTYEDNGGESGAKKVIQKVVQELLDGADFGATVKKYGNGPKAKAGGVWEWTIKGSLANKDIDKEIFSLPIGEMSGVIQMGNGYQIVQVLDRQDAGCKAFESLQKEISDKMKYEERAGKGKKIIDDIRKSAAVSTIFDPDPNDKSATKSAEKDD